MKTTLFYNLKVGLLLSAILLLALPAFSQVTDGYELVWSDEFDNSEIDLEKWGHVLGANQIWSSAPHADLTDHPEYSFIREECLVFKGKRTSEPITGVWQEYASAGLTTKDKKTFKYGKFEIKIKLPESKKGYISGFFLSRSGLRNHGLNPIDMEIPVFLSTNGYLGNGVTLSDLSCDAVNLSDISDDFHTITFIWEPDRREWFFDGTLMCEDPNAQERLDHELYLCVILDIGGNWGGPGLSDLPQEFVIDYIRVYQKQGLGINDVQDEKKLSISGNQLQIHTSSPSVQAVVYSMLGEQKLKTINPVIDISALEKGVYLLSVMDGEKQFSEKFVKE